MNSLQIRVGLFLLVGVLVGGVLIFLVGDERHMFERKARLHTTFDDVAGLKVGSPVRMGGVDVGFVEDIDFATTTADRRIHVYFSMVSAHLPRVRGDSVVRIVSKGLLGDKALEVTQGSRGAVMADGGTLPSEASEDFATALHGANQALGRANAALGNLVEMTRPLASPQVGNDIAAVVRDLRTITHHAAEGTGSVHELLVDPRAARDLEATMASARSTMARLSSTADHVDAIAREARSGGGLVHTLIYDRQGGNMVRDMASASREVAAITRDVRTGDGGLHQIIYGQEGARAAANIEQATASVRDILGDMRAGRGTLGALLVDPSLYEDIKTLVGNVQRNEILRALVRYSIHQDEAARPGVTARPAAPPPAH